MVDPNVFAVLIPCDKENRARDAFRLRANLDCYHKGAESIAEEAIIDSRDPTPAPESLSEEGHDFTDHILLTFDKKLKNPQRGWQFGTDPRTCDVLLGHRGTKGVSSRHFCIVIVENYRIKLYEDSKFGTAVGYDEQAKEKTRRNNAWLLSFESGRGQQWEDVRIYVPDAKGLAFRIKFPNHEAGRPEYLARLRTFMEKSRIALPALATMDLNSNPPTTVPSQPRTPYEWPIYLDDGLLGRGQFGEVRRVIHAGNGEFYAAKKFYSPSLSKKGNRKRQADEGSWLDRIRNEIIIMKDNPHPNIMQVIEFHEMPEPFLVMPYYPLGNLQDLKDVTQEQYVSAFCQILLGLHHLHERGVVHRDLKPENLLVAAPFTIIIADFGLSKMATNGLLTTFCGTHLYAAPEVYPGNSDGYGPAVDIWSTGVIFLAFIYDPPGQPDMKGVTPEKWNMHWSKHWSKALVNKVNDFEDDDRVIDILINMVKIQPEERFTAEQCLQRGCSNGLFRRRNDGHIIGAEEALDDNNTETVNVSDEASNDGGTTPTEQSALGSDIRRSNTLHASANLDGHFHRRELRNSPTQCSQTIPVGGSNSGPPTRREMTTSWSWTIGPSSSGPDDLTGLFMKKDCFTSSLESKRTINDLQDEGPPSDGGRAEPKRGSDTPPDPASFEERILELLVGK